MSKLTKIILAIILLSIFALVTLSVVVFALNYNNDDLPVVPPPDDFPTYTPTPTYDDYMGFDIVKEQNGVILKARYDGSNNWTYVVTGQKPTPCHLVAVDAIVAESFPEQVSINVEITPATGDVFCAQVIEEFTHTGIFSASEKASISLNVKTSE